jgi:hypothetical protein
MTRTLVALAAGATAIIGATAASAQALYVEDEYAICGTAGSGGTPRLCRPATGLRCATRLCDGTTGVCCTRTHLRTA